jgi:hypothetical protein
VTTDGAHETMDRPAAAAIDTEDVGLTLEDEGVASSHRPFRHVLDALEARPQQLGTR